MHQENDQPVSQSASVQSASTQSDYALLIVGMGPVGLIAAYEAARKGNKVMLLEKRNEADLAIRRQIIVLTPESKYQLIKMLRRNDLLDDHDLSFINSLAASNEIPIGKVQRFVMNRIMRLNDFPLSGEKPIALQYLSTVEDVNLGEGRATIKQNQGDQVTREVTFGHIVLADGARAETLDKVNTSLGDKKITRETPSHMSHINETYHLSAAVTLSMKNGENIRLPAFDFVSSFMSHKLFFMRLDKKSHKTSEEKSVKMGFVGEIPKELFDDIKKIENNIINLTKDKENAKDIDNLNKQINELTTARENLILGYVKKSAASYLKIPESDLNVKIKESIKTPNKNKLKTLVFQGGSKKADKASVVVNGHGSFLIGDAFFSPNYALGHGLNDGMQATRKLRNVPKTGAGELSQFINEYDKIMNENAQFSIKRMNIIRIMRKFGLTRKKLSNQLETEVDKMSNASILYLRNLLPPFCAGFNKDDLIVVKIKKKFDSFSVLDPLIFSAKKENNYNIKAIEDSIKTLEDFIKQNSEIVRQYRYVILEQIKELLHHILLLQKSNSDREKFIPIQTAHHVTHNLFINFNNLCMQYDQELLARQRQSPNQFDSNGCTPLYYAIQHGNVDLVKQMLEIGGNQNPDLSIKSGIIFHYNVMMNIQLTDLLLKAGANPFNALPDGQESPFMSSLNREPPLFNPIFALQCITVQNDKIEKLPNNDLINIRDRISSIHSINIWKSILKYDHNSINVLINLIQTNKHAFTTPSENELFNKVNELYNSFSEDQNDDLWKFSVQCLDIILKYQLKVIETKINTQSANTSNLGLFSTSDPKKQLANDRTITTAPSAPKLAKE